MGQTLRAATTLDHIERLILLQQLLTRHIRLAVHGEIAGEHQIAGHTLDAQLVIGYCQGDHFFPNQERITTASDN